MGQVSGPVAAWRASGRGLRSAPVMGQRGAVTIISWFWVLDGWISVVFSVVCGF